MILRRRLRLGGLYEKPSRAFLLEGLNLSLGALRLTSLFFAYVHTC